MESLKQKGGTQILPIPQVGIQMMQILRSGFSDFVSKNKKASTPSNILWMVPYITYIEPTCLVDHSSFSIIFLVHKHTGHNFPCALC